MTEQTLTLSQLSSEVHSAISNAFPRMVWLVAEISELNVNRNGHCYLELVEIDEETQRVIARSRATIWSYSFLMIKSYFETSTGQRFKQGIKVMVEVSIEFHQLYGLSLNIKNINPTYTLGDMAVKRKAIIEKLKSNGVYSMNKELELPLVAQRIAIISSPTAAGLQDFMQQLQHNPAKIAFHTELFEAIMQGEQTAPSVIAALEAVAEFYEDYDLVVIIRGGGAQLDLASFDDYELANNVAQFPLPVITGIGHDKDETIIDLVACHSLKTPTAVAEFLISGATQLYQLIKEFEYRLQEITPFALEQQENYFAQIGRRLNQAVHHYVDKEEFKFETRKNQAIKYSEQFLIRQSNKLGKGFQKIITGIPLRLEGEMHHFHYVSQTIKLRVEQVLHAQQAKLDAYELCKHMNDPKQILMRGYSVLYKDGKLIKSSKQLQDGDEIETHLANGKVKSVVTKK
ncbi:MAG: exodeoxyribonuclease VII large subunit [Mangrovibacterium sp.]